MTNLLVRNVDDEIARALKQRASEHGVSAEAEHRRILENALLRQQLIVLNHQIKRPQLT